jgi:hypothetical protein
MASDESAAASYSTTGAPLSKQAYVERVDRICAASSAQINTVLDRVYAGRPYGEALPADQAQRVVDRVAPIIRAEIAAARDVPPPEGDEAAVEAIYDEMDRALGTVERDPRIFALFGQGTDDDPFAAPARLAGDYGLAVCALGSPDVD